MSDPELFSAKHLITPDEVGRLIDFSPGESARSMADLQTQGVAAIYNFLCLQSFAYLADEVGTGKTYQALGVAALVWHLKPDARILFIAPRENVQSGWLQEYRRFFRTNYLAGGGDDRASSLLLGTPLHSPVKVENLREWLVLLNRPQRSAAILRHTSFMRPIYTKSNDDPNTVWGEWRKRLANLGLHGLLTTLNLTKNQETSWVVNRAFAGGVNQFLGKQEPFDLVVVDEAQCLRNPDNQSNSVLHDILKGRVRKWLFLSATPAHSGPKDIQTVLNRYPDNSENPITAADLQDLAKLQDKLQNFMVRRPRAYVVNGQQLTKDRYRADREKEWAVVSHSALSTLAMGLVQKRLVPILGKRSYRYHIGFLSSFESLQASVRHLEKSASPEPKAGEESPTSDFYIDSNEKVIKEIEAPDSGFINRLTTDFSNRFNFPLPHPKLDRVVNEIARLAFGEDATENTPEALGGEKLVVFNRRISTVEAMRDRLDAIYHERISQRVKRCWNRNLDWKLGTGDRIDDESTDSDAEYAIEQAGEGSYGLRYAMQDKQWLGRFRRTFRDTGGNALFFEENWLYQLCRAGGQEPETVANKLPDSLWAASWAYAARRSGNEYSLHRADRLHYLAYHGVNEQPELFGLGSGEAKRWLAVLQRILPAKVTDKQAGELPKEPRRDPNLFSVPTFWTAWDRRFAENHDLALPGASLTLQPDELYRRKILQTVIGQSIRLTDALIDLYYAGPDQGRADNFLNWLASDDRDALRLSWQFSYWIQHLELILTSALGETEPLEKLAGRSYFEQLNTPAPVVGITGGSGSNPRAIQQFRTPGYPLVITCTDTLKEGVNLHLFCDRVVHYGVAWTSGDLEQRIGRVDRYFGRIERRLKTKGGEGPTLDIYYPYIANSIEQNQVLRVIARKKEAEALMDSPLASGNGESRDLAIDPVFSKQQTLKLAPFTIPSFNSPEIALLNINREALLTRKRGYEDWANNFTSALKKCDLDVIGNLADFRSPIKISREERGPTLRWGFDADLRRYLLRLSPPLSHYAAGLKEPWSPLSDLESDRPGHEALLVPDNPLQQSDGLAECLARWFAGEPVQPEQNPPQWLKKLKELEHSAPGRYLVEVGFGKRKHKVELDLHRGLIRAWATIAKFDQLPEQGLWDGIRSIESVRRWATEESKKFALGAIDLDPGNLLRYVVTLVFDPNEPPEMLCRFIQLVGERADTYEAAILGTDMH